MQFSSHKLTVRMENKSQRIKLMISETTIKDTKKNTLWCDIYKETASQAVENTVQVLPCEALWPYCHWN